MPALAPTDFSARIVWLGRVTSETQRIRSEPNTEIALDWDGIPGDTHSGLNRPSCSRLLSQYARGTEIRNVRQLAIMSEEEVAEIAQEMGLETLQPEWLGASLVVSGLPDFSHLPPSSRLQLEDGGMLVVDMQNRPCQLPAREIAEDHPGEAKRFKAAAKGRRGVTAWVERPGVLRLGESLRLHVPDQRPWAGRAT
ncbi:MOSC domain-containing protein [Roseivivax sp. THAF30]|uniref:MOSC domain-containing protein n=1 Tax=Roseivivax sp. THAF30 TaxID=2587852 RepID=UPI00126980E7|nr:MOSC domain-containing protein [Roseivivax sp. THAF30]QFT64494.1 Putative metal-sulfur cluster biosynthesis proteins YuaD [Roseivivax sp. THAF30]